MANTTEKARKEETKETEFITIPKYEYLYLLRVDALMDVLLQSDTYNATQVLACVKRSLQHLGEDGAEK